MNKFRSVASISALALVVGLAACGDDDGDDGSGRDEGDAGAASAEFTAPADGAEVSSPVEVEMAAEGIDIVEAAEPAEGEGHFHVIVDHPGCIEPGDVIPEDDTHHHFGDASTSAEIDLEPGEHSLCLQIGDGTHNALDATHEIDITVVE